MSTRAVPFGKYHLLERVNVGGMAEVYKGKMVGVEGFEKLLAIKRILPNIAADKDFITMFIDEAKISVQLTHSNIAQTFELGRINDTYYIALEYVPGRDLRALYEKTRKRSEVVPHELACYVMSRVAEGLDYAHRKKDAAGRELGIIHRDISPQNVLVSYEGEVKLIDFGIAKAANKMMKTQAGILKGKFGYMSPEQVRGVPLDRRSDIFAVGIVLYELLTGDRLFVGESDYSVLEKVRAAHVPRPTNIRRSIPAPLEKIVLRALAKDPDDRYQHASELVADLQRFLLSQERLFTREDLAAYVKGLFPDEFEREKRSLTESVGHDEGTKTGTDTPTGESMEPSFRVTSSGLTGSRPEGAAGRSMPAPPAAPYIESRGERRGSSAGRPSTTVRPEPRKAERPTIRSKRSVSTDEEATATATNPVGGDLDATLPPTPLSALPPLVELEEMTPTPDQRMRDELFVGGGEQTHVARDLRSEMKTDAIRVPVTPTQSMPKVSGRLPPPIRMDEFEDEATRTAPSAAASRPRALFDTSEETDGDRTRAGYSPRRVQPGVEHRPSSLLTRQNASPRGQWTIVPITVAVALVLGFLSMRAAQHRWPFATIARQEDDLAAQAVEPIVEELPLATLRVVTDPPDAQLLLDGKLVKPGGDEPFVTEHLAADRAHTLLARKDGFDDATREVTVKAGDSRQVDLTLDPNSFVLSVTTEPSGATILIDGRGYAKTPEKIGTLETGEHTVRVELKCYMPVEETITLDADRTLSFKLKPMPGECLAPRAQAAKASTGVLHLISRPPAYVTVDGRDIGRMTPLRDFQLPAGPHTLRLEADGRSKTLEIDVVPGRAVTKIEVLR